MKPRLKEYCAFVGILIPVLELELIVLKVLIVSQTGR